MQLHRPVVYIGIGILCFAMLTWAAELISWAGILLWRQTHASAPLVIIFPVMGGVALYAGLVSLGVSLLTRKLGLLALTRSQGERGESQEERKNQARS